MASMIKREESPETFLRTILRTSTLPRADFPDNVSASSAASTYKEEDVEPPVQLPNTMFAQQHFSSRESSISNTSTYQGSSPRKYKMHGHSRRDLFFPAFAVTNAARQEQDLNQMVSQDAFGSLQEPQLQFPPFMQEDFQQTQQFSEQLPVPKLQLDGAYRVRSKSEEIHDLVVFSRNLGVMVYDLAARANKAEVETMTLRNNFAHLPGVSIDASQSAPGPTTRYRDATASRLPSPSTPTKERYEPFQKFQLSSPGLQDDEPFGSKLAVGKSSKKGEKTRARRTLKVKIPGGKGATVPLGMATPSSKIDASLYMSRRPLPSANKKQQSGYLIGNMTSGFPNLSTPTSGQPTGAMGTGFLLTPTPGYPSSPVTPGRIGPPSTQKRGVTSINKRKNHTLKESMPPARAMVPKVPLTDTEVIVYFFQSVARPPVALRLYARHWGPAGIVDVLNAHRNIEGGYLRNTCSVKCITAINRGKDRYGTDWEEAFRSQIEDADDVTATDMLQYDADDMEGVLDYEIASLNKGLVKHPQEGEDGGIFTRCVKYCIEHGAPYTLGNVHELALALQTGVEPKKLVPDGGEEVPGEAEEDV